MQTRIIKINPEDIELSETKELLEEAGRILKAGGLVAFPTETVYGLGGNAMDAAAAASIYRAKGRPSDNPLIVHIADKEAIGRVVREVPPKAEKLMDAFWPGPLTLIMEKSGEVPPETTGGLQTVAVRLPVNETARALIRAGGGYIAAPSANLSGRPSPTTAAHVITDLNGVIDMIIDGGDACLGLESTIVDMSVEPPIILRPGYITMEMIEDVIGITLMDESIISPDSKAVPKAPGMKYRHYAPRADLVVVEGTPDKVVAQITAMASEDISNGRPVGIITTDEMVPCYDIGIVKSIGTRLKAESIARNLYKILREFNDTDVEKIYSEAFDDSGVGKAIMNRLLKAAGQQVIHLAGGTEDGDIRRIIFVSNGDTACGPLACILLQNTKLEWELDIESRGLVVLFPEPFNEKLEAVAASHGMSLAGHVARQLTKDDVKDDTLFLTMELSQKIRLMEDYGDEIHAVSLGEMLGDPDLEIVPPYGEELPAYGECYELLDRLMRRLAGKINVDMRRKQELRKGRKES